ncbi:transglycosylase domain-containing protein [Aestuariimicrobium ganziense]|uniref:transglycosylase domain-containing protein n=1 Tax=Aestuariimicrobium ganziense TaxID=2773677 RepID=UPI0019455684|nr:transglycosylase domain-containing protein [Aestuariimicrobium ganziense]
MADTPRRASKPRAGNGGKGSAASTKARRGSQSTWRKVLKRTAFVAVILFLVLALVGTIGAIWFYQRTELPDPNKDFLTNTTYVNYRDGQTRIGSFAVQNRTTVPYDQISEHMKNAVIAAEDRSFWTNRGISPMGIARSVVSIVRGGEIKGGGSTITQQYIKIYYLTSDRTMSRKLRELALAVKMNKQRTKEEILRDYLNTIYFGRGAYGVQAASRSYFNTDADKLTLEQSAVLASVLNNPMMFDPSEGPKNADRLLERYRYVLDGMLKTGAISQAEHDRAAVKLPTFPEIPKNNRLGGPKGFLLTMVRQELLANGFTDAQISGGGLNVTTTFDAKLQDHAVKVAQSYTEKVAKDAQPAQDPKKLHLAIASVEVGTGEVLALYGGADYVANQRNWATTDRASASTFKTYAAIAGLRNGFSLRSMFNGNTFTPPGDSTTVRNEFSHQYGEVSLLKATEDSINTAFVDMTIKIPNGPAEVIKAAQDAGVGEGAGWDLNNRISLGTAETSPLDQAGGYATLANNGKRVANHVVKQVTDGSGKVIYEAKPASKQGIEEDIARDVTHALKSVVDQGTGGRVRDLGHDIAGKTGTSGIDDTITSAWFVAYTKQISTAVMFVEGDAGNGDLDPYKRPGDGTFFGGTYPAMVWADFMKLALEGQENQPFDPPAWVNTDKEPSTSTPSSSSPSPSTPSPTPSTPSPTPTPTEVSSAPTSQAPTTSEPTQEPTTQAPTTTQPTQTSAPPPDPTTTATNQSTATPTSTP